VPTRPGTKSGAEPRAAREPRRGGAAKLRAGARARLSLQLADAAHRPVLPRHRVARWLRAALAARRPS
jgi:hypothetical protein